MGMLNRIDCPSCMGEGKILTAVLPGSGERIYMCDICKDIWETRDFESSKAYSFDTYMLNTKRNESDFISWEYIIK